MPPADLPSPAAADEEAPAFYSIATLTARWGVCDRTIRRLAESGKLRAYQIGGQIRIAEEDAALFLEKSVISKTISKSNIR